jgi:hypothetical protein
MCDNSVYFDQVTGTVTKIIAAAIIIKVPSQAKFFSILDVIQRAAIIRRQQAIVSMMLFINL